MSRGDSQRPPVGTAAETFGAALLTPARRALYSRLAQALAGVPTPGSLDWLMDPAVEELLTALDGAPAPLARGNVTGASEFGPDAYATAAREFQNLFLVPGPQYVAPYESVHRGARIRDGQHGMGLLCGPPTTEVQQWYRLAALEIAPEFKDLPDHVALELAYLAHLCDKELEFAAHGQSGRSLRARQMQRDFLAGHLTQWCGALAGRICECSSHPCFRALANWLAAFPPSDLAWLERELGPSRASPLPDYATAAG